jgi:uncharacterized protein (DUF2252 family)
MAFTAIKRSTLSLAHPVAQQMQPKEMQAGIEDPGKNAGLCRRAWAGVFGAFRKEKKAIDRLFESKEARHLVTSLEQRKDNAKIEVVHAAYWMKGCSSLGRLRYGVLLRIGTGGHKNGGLCLTDFKEATKAAAPKVAHSKMPMNNARRVVEGACKLSPFLGQCMHASTLLGRDDFIRALMPQDLKLELDQLTREEATSAARYFADDRWRGARSADGRGDTKTVATATGSSPFKEREAPSWLWESVVQLVAIHELA